MIRGRDRDAELRKLQSRFRAIAERYDRSQKFPRFLRCSSRWAATPILIGLAALNVYLALLNFSPWPPLVTLRHIAAVPNCAAARAVGLAPARRGEPGYWPSHDADNDGIACEVWNGDESNGERLYLPRGLFARPQR
jgi:hypothetical protein